MRSARFWDAALLIFSDKAFEFSRSNSKPRKIRTLHFTHMHMPAPELGAAREQRHGLARIEQALGIEGALDGVESLQLGGAELHAHLVDFLHAHAVLPGDGAAHLDA